MNGEAVYTTNDYYRPFPDVGSVFSRDVATHSKYLLPVGTLSLSRLSPDWNGVIHIILPIEPVGGYGLLGERSIEYHNYHCRPNWLAYRMQRDKCELACDFRYFHKQYYVTNPPEGVYQNELALMTEHYDRVRSRFASARDQFTKCGWLCSDPEHWDASLPPPPPDGVVHVPLLRDLGGVSYDSNWSTAYAEGFPISRYRDQYEDCGQVYECDRVLPQTADGRDFSYVGKVDMWCYIGDTNGSLMVFYDPAQQIALTTIDW